MKLGVLFSGGKDSTIALHETAKKNKIECLITLISQNKESYMFHTPNIEVTELQSQSLEIPTIYVVLGSSYGGRTCEGCQGQREVSLQ